MAKQKKRTGKRMGPGRPAVVVDEVRQRLFNKHFDEGYSADDLWKQNRDCISKRTAQRLVKDFQTTLDWRRSPPATRERSDGARRWVLEVLRRVVDERPAAYLDEIQRELREVYQISIHTTICRYLHARTERPRVQPPCARAPGDEQRLRRAQALPGCHGDIGVSSRAADLRG